MSYKKLFNEEGEELVIVPLSNLKKTQTFKDVELGTHDEWDDPVEIVSTNPICYYVPVGHGLYKPTMSRKEFLKHACIEIAKLKKATGNGATIGDCIDHLLKTGFQLYDLCLALKENYKDINRIRVLADEDIPPFLKQKFSACFSEYCEWYPNHIEPEHTSECILNYCALNDEEVEEKAYAPVTKSAREIFPDTETQKEQKESPADKEVISRKTVAKTSQTSPSVEENDSTERLFASTKYKPIVKFNRGEIKNEEEGFERLEGTSHIGFSFVNAFDLSVKVRITHLIKENFFGLIKELGVGPFTNPNETKLFLTTIGVPYAAFARMCGICDTCNGASRYYSRTNARAINELANFEFAIVKPEIVREPKPKKEKMPKPESEQKPYSSRAELQTEAIRAKAKEDFERGVRFHSSEDLRKWFVSNYFKMAAFCREARIYSNTIYGNRQQLRRETIDKVNTWLGVSIAEPKTDTNPTLPKNKPKPNSEEQPVPPTEKKVDKEIREFLHGFPKYYFKTVSSILRALEAKFQRSDAIDVLCLTDEDLANPSTMSFSTSVCINKFVGKSVTYASK